MSKEINYKHLKDMKPGEKGFVMASEKPLEIEYVNKIEEYYCNVIFLINQEKRVLYYEECVFKTEIDALKYHLDFLKSDIRMLKNNCKITRKHIKEFKKIRSKNDK